MFLLNLLYDLKSSIKSKLSLACAQHELKSGLYIWQMMPEIRVTLFGANPNRKFMDWGWISGEQQQK